LQLPANLAQPAGLLGTEEFAGEFLARPEQLDNLRFPFLTRKFPHLLECLSLPLLGLGHLFDLFLVEFKIVLHRFLPEEHKRRGPIHFEKETVLGPLAPARRRRRQRQSRHDHESGLAQHE
jgi:hypothetical protein